MQCIKCKMPAHPLDLSNIPLDAVHGQDAEHEMVIVFYKMRNSLTLVASTGERTVGTARGHGVAERH